MNYRFVIHEMTRLVVPLLFSVAIDTSGLTGADTVHCSIIITRYPIVCIMFVKTPLLFPKRVGYLK